MAQCRWCDNKGFFLSVSRDGLCKNCQPIVVMDVKEHGRIIQDCMKLIEKSKNLKTKISRCDLLLEHAEDILRYENQGIPTIEPLPSQLISKYTSERESIIYEGVQEEVEKVLARAEIASSLRTSINQAENALLKIREGKKDLKDPSVLDAHESKVKTFIHKTQLNGFLEAARKAEFKWDGGRS